MLHSIGDVGSGEGQPLQSTSKAPVVLGVLDRGTIRRKLGIGVHRCRAGLAFGHASTVQNIQHILPLREQETSTTALNMHPKEVV
jgi:hypothetical protein